MNRKQRACVVAGFFLLVLSLLFAPTHPYRSPLVRYSFLFTGQGSIDFARLFTEWLLIVLLTGALFLALSKSKDSSTEIRSESSTVSPRKGRILPLLTVGFGALVLCLGVVSYREIKKVHTLETGIESRKQTVDTVKQMVNALLNDLHDRNMRQISLYEGSSQPDIRSILDPLQVDNSIKHQAWDDFYGAKDPEDFKTRFGALNLPQEAKAALLDAKFDFVKHPTLGELWFPHTMPPEERNRLTERLEQAQQPLRRIKEVLDKLD